MPTPPFNVNMWTTRKKPIVALKRPEVWPISKMRLTGGVVNPRRGWYHDACAMCAFQANSGPLSAHLFPKLRI